MKLWHPLAIVFGPVLLVALALTALHGFRSSTVCVYPQQVPTPATITLPYRGTDMDAVFNDIAVSGYVGGNGAWCVAKG